MKKTTSLLAIVGLLLLSVSLLSNASAEAPAFPEVPDVKLIIGTGLTPAFDLADFNTGDVATAYSVTQDFLGLNDLTLGGAGIVSYASYGAATVGQNTYRGDNEGGFGQAINKLKYSTYRINKLPKVGLNVGDSVNVVVGNYVSPASPPSFGNAAALIVSDTAQVSAIWADANTVTITALTGATGPVNVDVIAAPIASGPYGVDIDKERIEVCINLLANGTFAAASETTVWSVELAPGKATKVTPSWAGGAITYTFADNQGGAKVTPVLANWINYAAGQWYTARARVNSDNAATNHQFLLFNFSNPVVSHVDVSANVHFGVSATPIWIETPLYSNAVGTGYPQYQVKAGAAGSITIDEVQLVNCAPTLIDANRGNIRYKYIAGDFDSAGDIALWGPGGYDTGAGPTPQPTTSVANGVMSVNFAGAAPGGTAQRGLKWTASTTGGFAGIITPASTAGRQVGVKLEATKVSGTFTSLGDVVLLAAFGTITNGGSTFANGADLIASAEFGNPISDGTHYAVAEGRTGFHQFQFGLKKDSAGVLDVDNIDFLIDGDDPNYGDDVLYP
jgi:hypothetical protein